MIILRNLEKMSENDHVLQLLKEVPQNGWPEDKRDAPEEIHLEMKLVLVMV